MREVTQFSPWLVAPINTSYRAVGQTYFMQCARKHLAKPTVGDLNLVDTPQGTPSDPQSITFTCATALRSVHSADLARAMALVDTGLHGGTV